MRSGIQLLACILFASFALYSIIDRQNRLTEIRRSIPELQKELKRLQEENRRLEYEIELFDNPIHLMELSRKPEFGHLKYPYVRDVVMIPQEEEEE